MKNNLKKVIITGTLLAITQSAWGGSIATVDAAEASKSNATLQSKKTVVKTLANLPSVKLSNKSSVKITDVNILTQDEGKLITYTLTYTNNEKKACS